MLLYPSDFAAGSEAAFAHALKLALAAPYDLELLHVEAGGELDWTEFPGVRATLERWGALPHGSSRKDVAEAGLHVEKVITVDKDPVASILAFLKRHPTELIVLSTHQKTGLARWLEPAVAEPLARATTAPTLFVPVGVDGFVSLSDGAVGLERILVPVDVYPHPQPALNRAAQFVGFLDCGQVSIKALHVGEPHTMPSIQISMPAESEAWKLETVVESGDVVDKIVEAARTWPADLIVMSTAGHHGFLDAFRGSTTERVLRHASCPVLAVPHQA